MNRGPRRNYCMQDPVNPGESGWHIDGRPRRLSSRPTAMRMLNDIEETLRGRYGQDYRVECIRSPHEALARLERLAAEHEDVALVLAGETSTG